MNKFKFLFIFFLCEKYFVKFCESKNFSRSLTCPFEDIAKSISEHEREIQVVNFGANVDVVDSLIPKNFHSMVTNLTVKVTNKEKINKTREEVFMVNQSAILIFDSVQAISKYNKKIEFTNEGPKEFQFFVHIPKTTIKEIAASIGEVHVYEFVRRGLTYMYKYDRTEIIYSQYFLVEEVKFIKLYTFDWFTSQKACGKKKIIEVNRFDKKKKKWIEPNFKMKKFSNFHGCNLTFSFPGLLGITGNFLNSILSNLEKAFNFKLRFLFDNDKQKPRRAFSSRTKYEIRFFQVELFLMNDCLPPSFNDNLAFSNNSVKPHLKQQMSHPYFSTTELIVVSPSEEYSAYEKLKFPFDSSTWFLIIFTFAAAYLTIFIINFASIKIRNLVYGEQVKSPSLNVAAHFFGLGQLVLPSRSFARFIVISFIIYSLIIRTAWPGKSFFM
jgi:hypothetical protein